MLGRGRARDREERDSERLDESRGGEPPGEGENPDGQGQQWGHQEHRTADTGEQRLEEEPFADEAVQRGQSGDGEGARQEEGRRPGHSSNQAAESVHVTGVGGVEHRSGAEEQ